MKFVVVSIFDRASEIYGRPAFVPAKGSAIRSFTDEVNREAPDNELYRHPDDFDLYVLGDFDDQVGVVVGDKPYVLVRGKDVVISKE